MAPATLPGMLRQLRHNQHGFKRIAQANETVDEFVDAIERLNFVLQMPQLLDGARINYFEKNVVGQLNGVSTLLG